MKNVLVERNQAKEKIHWQKSEGGAQSSGYVLSCDFPPFLLQPPRHLIFRDWRLPTEGISGAGLPLDTNNRAQLIRQPCYLLFEGVVLQEESGRCVFTPHDKDNYWCFKHVTVSFSV